MNGSISGDMLSWLLTYAVHSTALLGTAWLITRSRRITPAAAEIIWKSALLGGLLTASVQLWLDLRPAGSVALGAQSYSVSAPPAPVTHTVTRSNEERSPSVDAAVVASEQSAASPEIDAPRAWSVPPTSELVLGAWMLIALVLGITYAARRLILMGRLGDRAAVTDGLLPVMLAKLARTAGVPVPRLTVTTRISSPVALGAREICLPETALVELDEEQQHSMLAHELAHLARRDPTWLLVASGIERVLWFQPLNRIARREISTVAEFLSDDWAVRRTGSGVALARCLAQVAEWIQASPLGVPVAGMAEERSLLVTRVARLLENTMPTMTPRRVFALGALAVLLATVIVVPSVAGKPAPPPAVAAASADNGGSLEVQDSSRTEVGERFLARLQNVDMESNGDHRVLSAADSAIVLALIGRLKDEDAEVRAAAAHALAKLEDARAVPSLVDALKDSDKRVRSAAAEALAQFKDRRAIPGLQNALSDGSVEVQQQALEALSNFSDGGGVSSAAIIRLMETSHNPEIQRGAMHLLAELHDRSAAPNIRALLASTDADVRVTAIEALSELRDDASAPMMLQKLTDPSAEVRTASLNALEELHARIPDASMISLFKDRDADVRQRAAHLAGERSMTGLVSQLIGLFEDSDADVRVAAVEALANIADDAARQGLRRALTSKDAKVRRAAVEALGDRRE